MQRLRGTEKRETSRDAQGYFCSEAPYARGFVARRAGFPVLLESVPFRQPEGPGGGPPWEAGPAAEVAQGPTEDTAGWQGARGTGERALPRTEAHTGDSCLLAPTPRKPNPQTPESRPVWRPQEVAPGQRVPSQPAAEQTGPEQVGRSTWTGGPLACPGAGPVPLNFLARRLSFEPVGDRRGNTSGQPRAPQSLQLFRDLLGLRRPWLSGFWGVAPPPPWGAGPPACACSSSLPCSVVSAVLEEAPVLGTWQSQARQSTPLLRERG